ncbi:MAG: hypothetical protein H0X71_01835 [Rubrobacter sp.]|nr:hypothetical protein [Rubrobacter sp.]
MAAILSVLAFALAAREAHSQQLPGAEVQQQPAEEFTGPVANKPASIPPSKTAPEEASPPETTAGKPPEEAPFAEIPVAETPPVEGPLNGGALPPGSRPGLQNEFVTGPVERVVEPVPVIQREADIQIRPVPGQIGRYDLAPSPGPGSSTPVSGPELPDNIEPATLPDEPKPDAVPSPGVAFEQNTILAPELALESEPSPELAPPASGPTADLAAPGLVLAPVAFEENELVLPDAGEAPVVPGVGEEETYVVSGLQDSVSDVVEAVGSAAASALESFAGGPLFQAAMEERGLVDAAFAGVFSIVEVEGGSSVSRHEEPSSASVGSGGPVERPLRDTPQPVSPFAPAAGASFTLSGSSVLGPGGLALLLCILVSCLMLSRRGSELLLALHDLPKPSSAPRLPLERPG